MMKFNSSIILIFIVSISITISNVYGTSVRHLLGRSSNINELFNFVHSCGENSTISLDKFRSTLGDMHFHSRRQNVVSDVILYKDEHWNYHGETLLTSAILVAKYKKECNINMIKPIIDAILSVYSTDVIHYVNDKGFTPLMVAIQTEQPEIAEFLIDNFANIYQIAYPKYKNQYTSAIDITRPTTALSEAIKYDQTEIVNKILHLYNIQNHRFIQKCEFREAIKKNNISLIKQFMSIFNGKLSINDIGNHQNDPLPIFSAIVRDNIAIAEILLQNDAIISSNIHRYGKTSFQTAIYYASFDMVNLLLKYDATILENEKDSVTEKFDGEITTLELAIGSRIDCEQKVRMLVKNGATVTELHKYAARAYQKEELQFLYN